MKNLCYICYSSGETDDCKDKLKEHLEKLYEDENLYNNFVFITQDNLCLSYCNKDKHKEISSELLKHCNIAIIINEWEIGSDFLNDIKLCNKFGIPYIIVKSISSFIDNNPSETLLGLINKG